MPTKIFHPDAERGMDSIGSVAISIVFCHACGQGENYMQQH